MHRAVTSVIAAAGLLAASVGTVSAAGRGGDWEKVPASDPFTLHVCGTQVTFTELMNKEYIRTTTDDRGIIHEQITGAYKVKATTSDGREATIQASGPSHERTYDPASQVFIFGATGLNFIYLTPAQAAEMGMPIVSRTSGPIKLRVNPDGTIEMLKRPAHVVSLCQLLH